jgi:CheY-like chemotaxis protein
MSEPLTRPPVGLLLCEDFIWTSRIAGAARARGLSVKTARTLDRLEELARAEAPRCIVFDLETKNVNVSEAVQRIRAVVSPPPRFTAFGSHVDVVALRAARDAGCDPVLARSQFAENLEALLQEWLS